MNDTLLRFIHHPTDAMSNFYLALWYETEKHYSPACSFYLRTIQFAEDKRLIYECLIRMYYCFNELGSRDRTCEHLLKSAINTIPSCPYAYYLLAQLYEKTQNWMDMYTFCCVCLNTCNFLEENLKLYIDINFPGKYSIIFYKALSAWWYGKTEESRKLFQLLMVDYVEDMNLEFYNLIQNNISRIGTGPKSQSAIKYNTNNKSAFKFSFNNLDKIDENFSQVMQDMFVLTLLDGKKNGTYLEIGSAHPFTNNNTALLEKFDWYGLGIENNKNYYGQYKNSRKNPIVLSDATSINYKKILKQYFSDYDIIDYLQLDIEPCQNTFEALVAIPFDKYKFKIITYEHDYYIDMTRSYRDKSRNYLHSLGYVLLVNDISPDDGSPFEDWWINPSFIDTNIVKDIKSKINGLSNTVNPVYNIMFK